MREVIETALNLDCRVGEAKGSHKAMEALIEDFKPFLHGRVVKYSLQCDAHRQEDLFSVAMVAFYEAIRSYDPEKGHFFPFVDRVVCGRIVDQLRMIYRHEGKTVPLEEEVDGQLPNALGAVDRISVFRYEENRRHEYLVDEIEQFKSELLTWGITMETLSKHSPKHRKLRDIIKSAIAITLNDDDILQTILLKRYVPVKTISKTAGVSPKKLERARTFILAAVIIKTGDYSVLSSYVDDIHSFPI